MNLSIVIPAYNAEKYIAETIESALAQTVSNYEVVIVNDGSTDGTESIIQRYAHHPLVRLHGYHTNRGAPHAYNHGLLHSEGKYVTFLDADDLYLPTYCERVIEEMERIDADMGYANLFALDGREKKTTTLYGHPRDPRFPGIFGGPTMTFPEDPAILRSLVLQGVHISPRSIYKRSLFLEYGLEDHRLRITHDWLRHITFMLHQVRCVFVSEPLGYYRFHPEGNSQRDPMANFIENIKVLEIVLSEKAALLRPQDATIVKAMLVNQRTAVMQALADSAMTTVQIIQYLSDKRF